MYLPRQETLFPWGQYILLQDMYPGKRLFFPGVSKYCYKTCTQARESFFLGSVSIVTRHVPRQENLFFLGSVSIVTRHVPRQENLFFLGSVSIVTRHAPRQENLLSWGQYILILEDMYPGKRLFFPGVSTYCYKTCTQARDSFFLGSVHIDTRHVPRQETLFSWGQYILILEDMYPGKRLFFPGVSTYCYKTCTQARDSFFLGSVHIDTRRHVPRQETLFSWGQYILLQDMYPGKRIFFSWGQ